MSLLVHDPIPYIEAGIEANIKETQTIALDVVRGDEEAKKRYDQLTSSYVELIALLHSLGGPDPAPFRFRS